jgi:hypothetical protein
MTVFRRSSLLFSVISLALFGPPIAGAILLLRNDRSKIGLALVLSAIATWTIGAVIGTRHRRQL